MTQTDIAPVEQSSKLAAEIRFLDSLRSQDKGMLALLRRNAGNSLIQARGPVASFYGLAQRYSGDYAHEAAFLIATLFASDKDGIDGKSHFRGNFGDTIRALRLQRSGSLTEVSPLDRTFNKLLDADFDPEIGGELTFRLRQMTKRVLAAKDRRISINWPQLLYDIKRWNHEKKFVQKQWARSYYAPEIKTSESDETQLKNSFEEQEM